MKFLSYLLIVVLLAQTSQAGERILEDVIDEVNVSVLSITVDTETGEQALGAGFVISAEGYIVTNAHVVEEAKDIQAETIYGDSYKAKLVGVDKKTDIALLKAEHPLGLEPVHFADSDAVRVGQTVFAIGNPYGLGNSVSSGIISAKERDIEKGAYDNFLQTDAAINQGNSGGPLFNMNGEVVGMNTAIFSEQGENIGLGFATPSNMVQWVVNSLQENGKVERGWLGLSVRPVRTNGDNVMQLAIAEIIEDSPAAKAGLKVGDIIERLSNISLKNSRLFSAEIAATKPQTKLSAVVKRDGRILNFDIEVSSMPSEETSEKDGVAPWQKFEDAGLSKEQFEKAVEFTELGITAYYDETAQNFLIIAVEPETDAAQKGVVAGNLLLAVDNKKLYSVEDLQTKIKQAAEKGTIELQVKSGQDFDTITVKLGK